MEKIKILLIEDNFGDVRLIKEYLSQSKNYEYYLKNINRVSEAKNFLNNENFDIILLDLCLPDSDGLNTIQKIVSLNNMTPIILFTCKIDQNFILNTVKFGIQDYLNKSDLNYEILERSIIFSIERERLTKKILDKEKQISKIIEIIDDGFLIVNNDGKIKFSNRSALELLGIEYKDLEDYNFEYSLTFNLRNEIEIPINSFDSKKIELKKLDILWNGEMTNLITLHDITDKIKLIELMKYSATHDYLTELPNRRLLIDRLNQTIKRNERMNKKNEFFGLFLFDLDNFKYINDTYGHLIGDKLLKEISNRLIDNFRKVDTICRYGGDEFILIFEGLSRIEQIEKLAIKLLDLISLPFYIDKNKILTSISIGISLFALHSKDQDELLEMADKALYKAKERKNSYIIYKEEEIRKQIK